MSEHTISRTQGTDEWGETTYDWWCHSCDEGGSEYDPQTATQEVERHKQEGEHE